MKSLKSQTKNSLESNTTRLYQVEDRISGLKNKVDELEHS
jgi:hypothetical protein